jgi:hypothetical protein
MKARPTAMTLAMLAGALVFGLGTSPLPSPPDPVSCGAKFDEAGVAYRDGLLTVASVLTEECLAEQPEHPGLRAFHGTLQEELAAVMLDPDPERRAKALRLTLPGPWDLPKGAPEAPEGTDVDVLLAEAEAMAAAGNHTQALLMTRQAHTLKPDCEVCRERVPGYWDAIEAQLRSNHRLGARHALMGLTDQAEEVLSRNLALDPWLESDYTQKSANILADIQSRRK